MFVLPEPPGLFRHLYKRLEQGIFERHRHGFVRGLAHESMLRLKLIAVRWRFDLALR